MIAVRSMSPCGMAAPLSRPCQTTRQIRISAQGTCPPTPTRPRLTDRRCGCCCRLPPGARRTSSSHRPRSPGQAVIARWRRSGTSSRVVARCGGATAAAKRWSPLEPDLCLTIPAGTSFQFRATGDSPLSAFAVTMPPWPARSDDELAGGGALLAGVGWLW